jgi:hypothetical protein
VENLFNLERRKAMSISKLSDEIQEIRSMLDDGYILKNFVPEDQLSAAITMYQSLKHALKDKQDQLDALVESERTKFRQKCHAEFQDKLARGESITSLCEGSMVATPRYTRDVPYSILEIHQIFQENDLNAPPVKSSIDTKSMDSAQKRLYKSLERVTGVTVVIREGSQGEDE